MNDRQREQKEKELREEMKSFGFGWINGEYHKPTEESGYGKKLSELSCIRMINSILAYDWFGQDAEEIMYEEEQSKYNYLADYTDVLGRSRVVELIQAQMEDIHHIARDTFRAEGLSYNSIVWKGEN